MSDSAATGGNTVLYMMGTGKMRYVRLSQPHEGKIKIIKQ